MSPEHWRLHLGLAILLEQQRRYGEAVELLAEANERTPGLDAIVVRLARSLVQSGHPQAGIETLDQMPGLRKHPAACFVRGLALRDLGQDLDALAEFQASAELRPDAARAPYQASFVLHRLGRHEEALEWAQRAAACPDASAPLIEHAHRLAGGGRSWSRAISARVSRLCGPLAGRIGCSLRR